MKMEQPNARRRRRRRRISSINSTSISIFADFLFQQPA